MLLSEQYLESSKQQHENHFSLSQGSPAIQKTIYACTENTDLIL